MRGPHSYREQWRLRPVLRAPEMNLLRETRSVRPSRKVATGVTLTIDRQTLPGCLRGWFLFAGANELALIQTLPLS